MTRIRPRGDDVFTPDVRNGVLPTAGESALDKARRLISNGSFANMSNEERANKIASVTFKTRERNERGEPRLTPAYMAFRDKVLHLIEQLESDPLGETPETD